MYDCVKVKPQIRWSHFEKNTADKANVYGITICSPFYRRRTWDLERWWLRFMYFPGSGDVAASSGVVSVCICSLVILCGNSLCSLGLPESHWVLPLMDARLFSVGHISALLLKLISLLLQWLPLLGLLWKSYLGNLTSGWVAGNNGAYAASLEFVLLISFWSSIWSWKTVRPKSWPEA